MRRRLGAFVALAVVVVAACGSARPEPLTDTKTLISDALATLESATSYHLVISYTRTFVDYTADLHIKLPSEAFGTVTVNRSSPLNLIKAGNRTYVQGGDFVAEYGGSYAGRLYGDRWIAATPDLLRTPVLDLEKLTQLPAAFLDTDFSGKRVDHVDAATEWTAELESDWGNMYISERPPHALVKVESLGNFVALPGFTNVSFELLEYNDPVVVQPPEGFADPKDPKTLPAQYQVDNWQYFRCDFTGCGVKGTAVNRAGTYPDPAASTFTFLLTRDPHYTPIDRCSGSLPVVPFGQTVAFTCRVTSRAWQNFATNGGSYEGDVFIDNPAYDG